MLNNIVEVKNTRVGTLTTNDVSLFKTTQFVDERPPSYNILEKEMKDELKANKSKKPDTLVDETLEHFPVPIVPKPFLESDGSSFWKPRKLI